MAKESFTTKFPSLSWFKHYKETCESHIITCDEKGALSDLNSIQETIEKNCLDKQKVQKIINKLKEKLMNRMCSPVNNTNDILNIVNETEKELEL